METIPIHLPGMEQLVVVFIVIVMGKLLTEVRTEPIFGVMERPEVVYLFEVMPYRIQRPLTGIVLDQLQPVIHAMVVQMHYRLGLPMISLQVEFMTVTQPPKCLIQGLMDRFSLNMRAGI
jgi:hypothetical protein